MGLGTFIPCMEKRFRFFRSNSPVLLILIAISVILIVINGCLYKTNKVYRRENRDLIIQNDSVLSINIELNEELNNYKRAVFKSQKKSLKN